MDDLRKYSPKFTDLKDAVAFAVHLSVLQLGCKLVGLREDQDLDDLGSVPQGWNDSKEMYTFKYKYSGSPTKPSSDSSSSSSAIVSSSSSSRKPSDRVILLIRIISTGDNDLTIAGTRKGSSNVVTLDVTVSDHCMASSDGSFTDYAALYRDIDGLLLLIRERITYPLLPECQEPKKKDSDKSAKPGSAARDGSSLLIDGGRPMGGGMYPGLPYAGGGGIPVGGDFSRDLDPFAGYRGPGAGGIGVGPGGGGGSLMGPGHPLFDPSGRGGRPGGAGGARFDPYGPGPLGGVPGPDPDIMPRPGAGHDDFGMGSGRGTGGPGRRRPGTGGGGFGGGGFGGGFM